MSNPVIYSILSRVARNESEIGIWKIVELPDTIELASIKIVLESKKESNRVEKGFRVFFFKDEAELVAFANIYTDPQSADSNRSEHCLATFEGRDGTYTYELAKPIRGKIALVITKHDDFDRSEVDYYVPRHAYFGFRIRYAFNLHLVIQ